MVTGKYVNLYYKKYFWFFLLGVIALLAVDFFQLMIPEICGNIIVQIKESRVAISKEMAQKIIV